MPTAELTAAERHFIWSSILSVLSALAPPLTSFAPASSVAKICMSQAISPRHPGDPDINHSMHPCLHLDEIVRLIACELVALEGQATAVALACCCKSFEGPVLDVLWETQQFLDPLFKSLPGDIWRDGYNSFKRLPTTLEWARFRKYARRMRELELYGLHVDDLSSELLWVLQHCAANGPLLPNLKTLHLPRITGQFLPFIPLVLSPRTTTISIAFNEPGAPDPPIAIVASTITTLPTLCPNLRKIGLFRLPRDPMITAAVSGMFLICDRNILSIYVDSPLTEEAREVVYKLPDLHTLSVIIGRDTSSSPVVLPNLVHLTIEYDHDSRWLRMFHGATLGKLEAVTFRSESEHIGDFLETFETVALTTSISATLSTFAFYTSRPWRPNYRSLLPFTQLEDLVIDFSCERGCSSTIDDDIITNMARAMPKLEILRLGDAPCKTPTGITAKGLAALARYCPRLSMLCIHFRAASLSPPSIPGVIPGNKPTISQEDCALTNLRVGKIPVQEESTLMVALSLLRIFPRLRRIQYSDQRWKKVADAIDLSRQLADHSRATLETI